MRQLDQLVSPSAAGRAASSRPLGAVLDAFVSDFRLAVTRRARSGGTLRERTDRRGGWATEGRLRLAHSTSRLWELLAADAPVAGRSPVQSRITCGRVAEGFGSRPCAGKGLARSKVSRTVKPRSRQLGQGTSLSTPAKCPRCQRCDGRSTWSPMCEKFLLDARFFLGPVRCPAIQAHERHARSCWLSRSVGHTRAAKCAATALRAFLRFLVLRGLVADQLVAAVPTVVHRADGLRAT